MMFLRPEGFLPEKKKKLTKRRNKMLSKKHLLLGSIVVKFHVHFLGVYTCRVISSELKPEQLFYFNSAKFNSHPRYSRENYLIYPLKNSGWKMKFPIEHAAFFGGPSQ